MTILISWAWFPHNTVIWFSHHLTLFITHCTLVFFGMNSCIVVRSVWLFWQCFLCICLCNTMWTCIQFFTSLKTKRRAWNIQNIYTTDILCVYDICNYMYIVEVMKYISFAGIYTILSNVLTHWGRVMHRCGSKLTITGSDTGLPHGQRQAIIWTNDGILLIGSLGKKFQLKSIYFHSRKCIWKCRLQNDVYFISASVCQLISSFYSLIS